MKKLQGCDNICSKPCRSIRILMIVSIFICVCSFNFCSIDLDTPVLTVHQTISDVRGSYYQEKTVFLRCTVNSNPPARFIWKRGNKLIEQSKDNGVDIYEPLYTQVHVNTCTARHTARCAVAPHFFLLILSKACLTNLSPVNFILICSTFVSCLEPKPLPYCLYLFVCFFKYYFCLIRVHMNTNHFFCLIYIQKL